MFQPLFISIILRFSSHLSGKRSEINWKYVIYMSLCV